ncbi:MAG: phytanoyl-CoA dioxygenase family protein [Sphingosinicella sp.]
MKLRNIVKTLANRVPSAATMMDYAGFRLTHSSAIRDPASRIGRLIGKIRDQGYAVVENYWLPEACVRCIEEFEHLLETRPEHVQRYSDLRIFGAEELSPSVMDFHADPFLAEIASEYMGVAVVNAFTLANRVDGHADSKGSGEGWHKDASFRQFKAFIYLSDVGEANGPLQLVSRSHRLGDYLRDMKASSLPFRQLRIGDDQLDRILAGSPGRLTTFTGRAGTLILADTASIHRGRPPESGRRYALTNYYIEPKLITAEHVAAFKPVAPEKVLLKSRQSSSGSGAGQEVAS